jgi:hypothetical protein
MIGMHVADLMDGKDHKLVKPVQEPWNKTRSEADKSESSQEVLEEN